MCGLLRPGAGQLQRGVRAAAARAAQAARRVPRLLHGAGALPQHRGLRLPDDEAEVLLDGGQVTNGSAASRHVTRRSLLIGCSWANYLTVQRVARVASLLLVLPLLSSVLRVPDIIIIIGEKF